VLGSVRGDIGADSLTTTGHGSTWLAVNVTEGSSSWMPADFVFTASLTSPPGMNYDLYVYSSCAPALYGQSTNDAGQVDTVTSGWADTLGFDDSRAIFIEVRYVSGLECGAQGSWTLTVQGGPGA
jgi:hypothetical protein